MKNILIGAIITAFGFVACSKSNDSNPAIADYADKASGTYSGVVMDTVPATVIITKQATATVVMNLSIPSVMIPIDFAGVTASDGGSGKILLTITSGNTTISGTVNGKTLDCYFNLLHFIGTKP